MRAFSLNQPLFSFVDVGSGKERADHKIKGELFTGRSSPQISVYSSDHNFLIEMLRLFWPNQQCRHIIFGGCHDNGYLPNLDSFKHDPNSSERITLLETTPASKGYTELKFSTARFPEVFRSTPLPERPIFPPVTPSITPATPVVPSSPQSPKAKKSKLVEDGPEPFKSPEPLSSAAVGNSPPDPSSPTGLSKPWTTVGRHVSEVKTISMAPKKPKTGLLVIYLNSEGQRIDPPLSNPARAAQEALNKRISDKKLCNSWHLTGKCETEAQLQQCPFSHTPLLKDDERLALRAKARNRNCPKKSECRNVYCWYGHHCPFGNNCSRKECFFEQHSINKVCFA